MKAFVFVILFFSATTLVASNGIAQNPTEIDSVQTAPDFNLGFSYGETSNEEVLNIASFNVEFELVPGRLYLQGGPSILKFIRLSGREESFQWSGDLISLFVLSLPVGGAFVAFGDTSLAYKIISAPFGLAMAPCLNPSLEWRPYDRLWLTAGWDGEYRIFSNDFELGWRPRIGAKVKAAEYLRLNGGIWYSLTVNFEGSNPKPDLGWYAGVEIGVW